MSTEYDNDLLREGITRFRAGEFDSARHFIQRALDTADDLQTRAQANYFLSMLSEDPIQKRNYLEETLAVDMNHAEARRSLAILDGKLKPGEIVNPNKMPAQPSGTQYVQAQRFSCLHCGSRMVFTPDGGSLVCESCGQMQGLLTTARSDEQDFFIAMANGSGQRAPVAVQTFRCQGCGSNFVLAPDEISATCAYCGSTHVVALPAKSRMVQPDSILPMRLDLDQAAHALSDWVMEKKLTLETPPEPPRGLYQPVWLFDLDGSLPWKGFLYRNHRQVPVSGDQALHYQDIHIPGSGKLAALMVATLPEFDLEKAAAYDPRFLAGWMADVYDLPMAEASLEARRLAVQQVRATILHENGAIQELNYATADLMVSAFKLVLVPVWVITLRVNGQSVRALINGRSGSVHSELSQGGVAGWIGNLLGSR